MSYLIFLFCKTYSCFSPVLCSSAISFSLEALLPPFLHEMIPSLMTHWHFQTLPVSFPCSLLASFLLTEYVLGLLIKISSLWTEIFVEPGLFPFCSSLTLHEGRNLGLCAGSVLVLSFCLSSATHCHHFLVELPISFGSGCLPFFIQVWYICTSTVYVVQHGLTAVWTCCAFSWTLTSE